ncbi:MAG: hypothetical protein NC903_03550, partial [Candidatus Omnitrophica bacterium]|nr:hypothetical protein [Candidatus Omnitrophota bacterium]
SLSSEYLCSIAIALYKEGKTEEALKEFEKVLLIEPEHSTAKEYIQKIQKEVVLDKKKETIELTLNQLEKQTTSSEETRKPLPEKTKRSATSQKLKIKGESVLSLGITSQDLIWNKANADLNEKNWRILSYNAYNQGINTYDTRIYDRLRLEVDTLNKEGLNFHTNIAIDPWSFVGKSDKVTITSSWGDIAEIELKYWANTGYTIPETVYTQLLGNSFNLPEIKIQDNYSHTLSILTSGWWPWFDQFNIPALKIKREFKPLRELWFDYQKEGLNFRFFPLGLEDQAFTSDDPLGLSNHHIWWQPSPWILRWFPGRYNPAGGDYTKGFWDDSLAYLVRDSSGKRLTFLRGLSFEFIPQQEISLSSTFASPLHLWQDYDYFDSLASSNRLKYRITDNFQLGTIYNFRVGFNENKKDLTNHVWALDLDYEIKEGIKLDLEFATSRTAKDLSNSEYTSKLRGKALYFSFTGSLPARKIIDLEYGYNELKPKEEESFFTKWRLYLVHMSRDFESALADYHQSRKDSFWSRHIHFREPFKYYYAGLYYPTLKWEDIEPFRIGDGIDTGRDVVGLRIENSLWDKKLENLFDVRNVHSIKGKFIENVVRDEVNFKINERLITKLLGIYHKLPKTKAGIDPFLFDADTGDYLLDWSADPVDDAKDPSLKTASLGLEYKFFDWLSLNGIWEYTNDYTLAYDNFPRGVLNSAQMSSYTEDGKNYRFNQVYLYDQQFFPQPPYPFYNIFKTGLKFIPIEKLEVYLDYTCNEFRSAGPIDDNMNHIGLEVSFLPNKNLGFYLRYVYSRWKDLDLLLQEEEKSYRGHHNFFSELRYKFSQDDELILQYGESAVTPVSMITFSPFGTGLLTIDTQHIFRIYYRRKF